VRRLIAHELILSFVPRGEQRNWRSLTRRKLQLTRDRVRRQNQIECWLEEMRSKLSMVVSHLLGASGLRILHALAKGETDPKKLAQRGGERLPCPEEQRVDAWTGRAQPVHGAMLALQLQRLQLIDQQMAQLNNRIAAASEAASRRRDATGGSAWFGSGFCATHHRPGGRSGQYVPLGGGVDVVGGNRSRQGRKGGAEL